MFNFYMVMPLRDFWVRVFVGEGQLGAVAVRPLPAAPNDHPTVTNGAFEFKYGLPGALVGKELEIAADIAHGSPSDRASVTVELWQTEPAHFGVPMLDLGDPKRRRHLRSFGTEGTFDNAGKAHLSLSIEIG